MSAADQHNARGLLEVFLSALEDVECHLRIAYETATIAEDWWQERPGWGWQIRRRDRSSLKEEVRGVLDARNRLHALASEVAAHVVPPAGETGQQWVIGVLALADEAARLAEEEYGECHRYRGPMNPDFVAEDPDAERWRRRHQDDLRQIEKDYQRVNSGLLRAREHLDRVMSVVPTPDDVDPLRYTDEQFQCDLAELRKMALPSRAAAPRDYLFWLWKRHELGAAKVRDRWNNLTDEQRSMAAPEWPSRIGRGEKGTNAVKAAIRGVENELARGNNR